LIAGIDDGNSHTDIVSQRSMGGLVRMMVRVSPARQWRLDMH
jgi:hypothetical protein